MHPADKQEPDTVAADKAVPELREHRLLHTENRYPDSTGHIPIAEDQNYYSYAEPPLHRIKILKFKISLTLQRVI